MPVKHWTTTIDHESSIVVVDAAQSYQVYCLRRCGRYDCTRLKPVDCLAQTLTEGELSRVPPARSYRATSRCDHGGLHVVIIILIIIIAVVFLAQGFEIFTILSSHVAAAATTTTS